MAYSGFKNGTSITNTLQNTQGITYETASNAGAVLFPAQPLFLVYLAASVNNATGDGTYYKILPDTAIYNIGSDYNTATSTFTASDTGSYLFSAILGLNNISAGHTTVYTEFATSNRNYRWSQNNALGTLAAGSTYRVGSMVIADMDAGDTMTWHVSVSGSTKTIQILSAPANMSCSISGCLLG